MDISILKNDVNELQFAITQDSGKMWCYRFFKDRRYVINDVSPIGILPSIKVPKYINKTAMQFYKLNAR